LALDVFLFFSPRVLRGPRPIALKLCHMIGTWLNFMMQVQKFGGLSPKHLGTKNMQNFGQFCTTSEFDREYLRNEATYPKSERHTNFFLCTVIRTREIPPAFYEKSPVNFGPLTTWTKNALFWETILSP